MSQQSHRSDPRILNRRTLQRDQPILRESCAPEWTSSMLVAARWSNQQDRKSTRLNSSHLVISYAVFCLKKKSKRQVQSETKLQYLALSLVKFGERQQRLVKIDHFTSFLVGHHGIVVQRDQPQPSPALLI